MLLKFGDLLQFTMSKAAHMHNFHTLLVLGVRITIDILHMFANFGSLSNIPVQ